MPMILDTPLGVLLGGYKRGLARTLLVFAVVLLLALPLSSDLPPVPLACGIAIAIAALFPGLLWCLGRAPGLPIFPVFAATHLWAYALPLLTGHPVVLCYPDSNLIHAAVTVCGYLAGATLVWLWFTRRPPLPVAAMRLFDPQAGMVALWVPLVAAIAFGLLELAGLAGLLGPFLSITRAAILGLNTLSVFVLCLRWGSGQLPARFQPVLGALLLLQMAVSAASLLLIGAMTIFLIGAVAYTAGRGRVPVLTLALAAVVFAFLHVGKATMRERHWRPDRDLVLQPFALLPWYAEWAQASVAASGTDLTSRLLDEPAEGTAPLWWRSSTMQLLLLAEDLTPREVPFLDGATYRIIPSLLAPRLFNPNKLRTHEGTYRLNMHYGLQRYEDTWTTTIGWGLLNESFANYGYAGVAGLAVVLGAFYGWVTRFSAAGPILSLRALFAVLVLSYAFQAEFSAGVLVSALFQSSTALVALSFVVMRHHWVLPLPSQRDAGA